MKGLYQACRSLFCFCLNTMWPIRAEADPGISAGLQGGVTSTRAHFHSNSWKFLAFGVSQNKQNPAVYRNPKHKDAWRTFCKDLWASLHLDILYSNRHARLPFSLHLKCRRISQSKRKGKCSETIKTWFKSQGVPSSGANPVLKTTRKHTKVWMPCRHILPKICGILWERLQRELSKTMKMPYHTNTWGYQTATIFGKNLQNKKPTMKETQPKDASRKGQALTRAHTQCGGCRTI